MVLSKDQILNADDIKCETVVVPEWGGAVLVRTLTGAQRDAFEQSVRDDKEGNSVRNVRAAIAAWSIVDDDGNRLFSDGDVVVLGQKSGAALDRVWTVAQRLSGFLDEDVEELAKNSSSGQSDDSTSD